MRNPETFVTRRHFVLGRRERSKELDLSRGLLEVAQGRLSCRGRSNFAVDREVEVEPVLEWLAELRPAVEPGQVDVAACEAVERVRQAAWPVGRHEGQRAFGGRCPVPRTYRIPALDDHESRAVLGVVLDGLREHIQAVALGGRATRDRRRARLALLRD